MRIGENQGRLLPLKSSLFLHWHMDCLLPHRGLECKTSELLLSILPWPFLPVTGWPGTFRRHHTARPWQRGSRHCCSPLPPAASANKASSTQWEAAAATLQAPVGQTGRAEQRAEGTWASMGLGPNWRSRGQGCPSEGHQGLEKWIPGTSHNQAWSNIEPCPQMAGAHQSCRMAVTGMCVSWGMYMNTA